jgi:peptide/nickel transport system permease protein
MRRVIRSVKSFFLTFPGAGVGAAITLIFLVIALTAPLVHTGAFVTDPGIKLTPPQWFAGPHFLGTDSLGRDLLARIVTAVRISLMVAAAAVLVAGTVGVLLGVISGYFGKWTDSVVMRLTDTLMAIPLVLFAIAVMMVVGSGIRTLIFVIALTQWMTYARTARAESLQIREHEHVAASSSLGASHWRIMGVHILPNVLPSAIALATINVSMVILLEAGLSYLGLGVPLPNPSLGSLLSEGRQFITRAPWLAIYPGVALMLLVLGVNLLGDGLRSYLDPRSRERAN